MDSPMIIRSSLGKRLFLLLGGLAFVIIGFWMARAARSRAGVWSTDFGYALQPVIGVLGILFGLAVLGVFFYALTRPLLLIQGDRVVDPRRGYDIPYAEIQNIKTFGQGGIVEAHWLLVDLRHPEALPRADHWRRLGQLSDEGLILDLTFASKTDRQKAYDIIRQRMGEAQ